MWDNLSTRSIQVVFGARFKAGERGAAEIGTDDLLMGLVIEDQGLLPKSFFPDIEESAFVENRQVHVPFFSSELAEDLLSNLKNSLPHSQPVPTATDIPVSSPLEHTFASAESLRAQFQHSRVEPLHLLAAILKEHSGEGAKLLQASGITLEGVLAALGGAQRN